MTQMNRDELIAQIQAQTPNDPPLNLRGVDLSRVGLSGANLRAAILYKANLQDADLRAAYLQDANLAEANLAGAWLHRANFWRADLRAANLQNAILTGANLELANLNDVIMNWNSRVLISVRLQQAANEPLQYALAGWILIADFFPMCWEYYLRETDNDIWRETRAWAINLMKTWVKPGDDAPAILKEDQP